MYCIEADRHPLYSSVLRREQLCENLTRLGELQCATTRKSFMASIEQGCLEDEGCCLGQDGCLGGRIDTTVQIF